MIKGIGLDLCSIERMELALSREGFAERVFSEEELAYARQGKSAASHCAAAFAAKEALAKAGGWGLAKMGLRSCSVSRGENGPYFKFTEKFAEMLESRGITNVYLSISHETGMAAAMVVLEG